MSVSRRVLLGNVASAVNGAASIIAAARADLAADAAAAGEALLSDPPLTAACTGTPGAGFRRRSCCLIYRIAADGGAALCGDCVLLTGEGQGQGRRAGGTRPGADRPGRAGRTAL
jgi:ferric iron reductase protein FhuF